VNVDDEDVDTESDLNQGKRLCVWYALFFRVCILSLTYNIVFGNWPFVASFDLSFQKSR